MNLDLMEFILEIICLNAVSLKKLKDGAYVVNLDEYSDIGTHWIELYVKKKTVTLIALGLSIFQKKSKNLLIIKI